jgi:3-oxoacyl-(acyl-carrier-protein) synthase
MAALEAVMNKHNISNDSTSSSSSHGHALYASGSIQLLLLLLLMMSGLLILEHLIIWLRTKTCFLL